MARVLFWVVIASLLAILALVLRYPEPMLSPGALTKAHAGLSGDCFACHRPLLGSSSEKCTNCHEPDRIGLFTTRGVPIEGKPVGFHQALLEQDCMACHTDHRGHGARRPFSTFSHELLEPQTRGQCSGCHRKPEDRVHRGLRENCSTCHSTRAWAPATFDHDRYFVLDRDHDVACNTCHVEEGYEAYSCYGCHEHTPARIRAEHVEEGIRDFADCVECHRSADEPEKHGRGGRHDGDDDQEYNGDNSRVN